MGLASSEGLGISVGGYAKEWSVPPDDDLNRPEQVATRSALTMMADQ